MKQSLSLAISNASTNASACGWQEATLPEVRSRLHSSRRFNLRAGWGLKALNVDQRHPISEHVASFARFRSALGADLRHWIDWKVVPVFCHAAGILTRGKAAPNGPFGVGPCARTHQRWNDLWVLAYTEQDPFKFLAVIEKNNGPVGREAPLGAVQA